MTAATTRTIAREAVEGHVQPGDFRHRAACRSVDPEIFFPTAVEGPKYETQVSIAKAVCAGCPVLSECLAWALVMWISAVREPSEQGIQVSDMSVTRPRPRPVLDLGVGGGR